jgi:hypothetical protein
MLRRISGLVILLLCGIFLFSACSDESGDDGEEVEFPVLDGLSSASILRVNPYTLVYVGENEGDSYKLNRVDLNNPGRKTSQDIGSNVAVITATLNGSKIGIIQGTEIGYEAYEGEYIKIYDANNLSLLKEFPLAPPAAGDLTAEPLHHRDPSLAISDKYAVAATEIDGFFSDTDSVQQYISIYDIAGDKAASHLPVYSGEAGGARGSSEIGALMGITVNGDYVLAGGSTGTVVYKIGDNLALTKAAESDGIGNHWFKDNGSYVLESKSNTGTVKIWQWNGAEAPTAVTTVDINGVNVTPTEGGGSIQALCFDPDNSTVAYVYCKAARSGSTGRGTVGPSPNAGNVYKLDLSSGTPTVLFNFEEYNGKSLTGLWTIEKQSSGTDTYYVFSGSYNDDQNNIVGCVLTVKNPDSGEIIPANSPKVTAELFDTPYNTAVRTLKTFKTGNGVYFAAKNYTSGGANWNVSSYKFVVEMLD